MIPDDLADQLDRHQPDWDEDVFLLRRAARLIRWQRTRIATLERTVRHQRDIIAGQAHRIRQFAAPLRKTHRGLSRE